MERLIRVGGVEVSKNSCTVDFRALVYMDGSQMSLISN